MFDPDYDSDGVHARDVADTIVAGLAPLVPEGGYFITADITPLGGVDGVEFCLSLPDRCGVVAIPTQVFYDHVDAGRHLIRFNFVKRDAVLNEAVTRLRRLR